MRLGEVWPLLRVTAREGAASSALVIGGVAGAFWTPPKQLVATRLAFASGLLVAALAFDLFAEAFKTGGALFAGVGFLAGGTAIIVVDALLDRFLPMVGDNVTAFALLAGVTLDGVPENLALGLSLLESTGAGALTLLVAIFASNLPEALGGAVLASLADTLMPDAYRDGGPFVAFATVAGFFVSFLLSER